jgi:cysteine desulfurase
LARKRAPQSIEHGSKSRRLSNCRPTELIFTSGGTEANNLAIRGLVEAQRKPNGHHPHVITSAIEHPSVSNVCEDLEKAAFE